MSQQETAAREQLQFLLKLQSLLTEGRFVASYKFALLLAICDLCVEMDAPDESELRVPLNRIAEKFIVYYWRHVLPYVPAPDSNAFVLRQNTGRQAAIIRRVQDAHQSFHGSLSAAQQNHVSWTNLVAAVRGIVLEMPLWKLQRIGESVDPFIYRQDCLVNDCIELLPGVADCMRAFHGLISELIRTSWIRYIRQTNAAALQGDRDLTEFLFGAERVQLAPVAQLLTVLQSGNCFYCDRQARESAEVDHFVPWSRYPSDLGHNFVMAHAACNRNKGASLPAECHLAKWVNRNERNDGSFAQELRQLGIVTDWNSSRQVAHWAYESADAVGAPLWMATAEMVPITDQWRTILDVPHSGREISR